MSGAGMVRAWALPKTPQEARLLRKNRHAPEKIMKKAAASNESLDLLAQMDKALEMGDDASLDRVNQLARELQNQIRQKQQWAFVKRVISVFRELPWLKSVAMEWVKEDERASLEIHAKPPIEFDADALQEFASQTGGSEMAVRVRGIYKADQHGRSSQEFAAKMAVAPEFRRLVGWNLLDWAGEYDPVLLSIAGTTETELARCLLSGADLAAWEAHGLRQTLAQAKAAEPASATQDAQDGQNENVRKQSPRL